MSYGMIERAWHTDKVKTTKMINGNPTIVEESSFQIVKNPNRHRTETIIKALCEVTARLCELKDAEDQLMIDKINAAAHGLKQEEPEEDFEEIEEEDALR